MQIFLVIETPPRLWLDAYHAPSIPIAPGFSWQCDLGRWRSLEPCFALCTKIVFHMSICNYVASTALLGTVFALWLFFPCISIALDYYRVFHREFLWPTSAKWVQTLIFCIIVIRNGWNTKHSSHFWLNFMFLVQLLIFLRLIMTCVIPSQMSYSFIISNASCSMHCSSVEACLLWKCC